jgi:hypothetical protein
MDLVQSGRAVGGPGVRGRPCPADGTCYADVVVMGRVTGADVVLEFGPPFQDRFEGRITGAGRVVGTLTGYSDRPTLTLTRER